MSLSNFGRKKAGKLELGLGCQILEAGKLELGLVCQILEAGKLELGLGCQILEAGKLELGLVCQILEAGKLGDAPENLNFQEIYDIIKGQGQSWAQK